MGKYAINDSTLTDIADSIRAKRGTSEPILVSSLADEIDLIPTPSGSLQITQNDTYDVSQYASAVVNVAGGIPYIDVQDFTMESNATSIVFDYDTTKQMVAFLCYCTDRTVSSNYTQLNTGYVKHYKDDNGAKIGGLLDYQGNESTNSANGNTTWDYPAVGKATITTKSSSYYFRAGYTYRVVIIYSEV